MEHDASAKRPRLKLLPKPRQNPTSEKKADKFRRDFEGCILFLSWGCKKRIRSEEEVAELIKKHLAVRKNEDATLLIRAFLGVEYCYGKTWSGRKKYFFLDKGIGTDSYYLEYSIR